MLLLNPLFLVAMVGVALGFAALLSRTAGAEAAPATHRYEALDGLRGYLALFVFIHHAAVWHGFARTGEWNGLSSSLYTQLGQGSVAMFFMITGFLFFGKLLEAGRKPIDWVRLGASRVLRIVPLYVCAILGLFLVVAILSRFELRVPASTLLLDVFRWFSFALLGRPDLNGVEQTWNIVAGVTWSLAYEWFFYFSLPLLAVAMRRSVPLPWVVGSLLLVGLFAFGPFWNPGLKTIYFLSGMFAAVVAHKTSFPKVAGSKRYGVVALACVALSIVLFPNAHTPASLALFSVAFTILACGNSLFGVLNLKAAKVLGDLSYGVYLLHGLVLFVVLGFLVGPERTASLSVLEYWLVVGGCVPVLLALCLVTYRTVERPAMAHVPWLTDRLKGGWQSPAPAGRRLGTQPQGRPVARTAPVGRRVGARRQGRPGARTAPEERPLEADRG